MRPVVVPIEPPTWATMGLTIKPTSRNHVDERTPLHKPVATPPQDQKDRRGARGRASGCASTSSWRRQREGADVAADAAPQPREVVRDRRLEAKRAPRPRARQLDARAVQEHAWCRPHAPVGKDDPSDAAVGDVPDDG